MKKGDIILVSVARKAGFGPRHYGVYDGNGGVYHFSGETINDVYIQYSPIEEFAQGGHVKIDGQYKKRFTPTDIIERAAHAVGSGFCGFNLIDNNCEHFATWCVTGKRQSMQTDLAPAISKFSPIKKLRSKLDDKNNDYYKKPGNIYCIDETSNVRLENYFIGRAEKIVAFPITIFKRFFK